MSGPVNDLRFAIRMLLKNPGFTTVIVLTLGLGIGANTAIFGVLNAAVLRPLPYDDPEQLVMLAGTLHGEVAYSGMVSYADLEDFRTQGESFEQIGALRATMFTLTGVDEPERVKGAYVSAGFFSLLRVEPALGRLFRPEEDRPGAENVVVVSDGFWRHRLGANRDLAGQKILLDGVSFTVVGVLPEDFGFPIDLDRSEVWTTTALDAATFPTRGSVRVKAVGRLNPDVGLEQAQVEMDTIAGRLAQQFPALNTGRGLQLISLHERVVGETRAPLFMLLGAVGLVLLIACANVANILLARAGERQHEFALRAALGAGRGVLIRQLLTESALLAFLGAGLGVVLAAWVQDTLFTAIAGDVPQAEPVILDGSVLGFALAITVLTTLAFGLAPALSTSRVDLQASLKQGRHAAALTGRHRLSSGFVVPQVAVAFVLLVGGGLLARSFQRLMAVDPGFRPENVLAFQLSVPRSRFSDAAKRAELYRQVIERLEILPGVQSVGASTNLPLHPAWAADSFVIQGRPQPLPGAVPRARYDSISSQYFQTMGVSLLRGRFFNEQDTVDRPGVVIINETLANRYWPDEDPIGQRITLGSTLNDGSPAHLEIVGIVVGQRDTRLDAALEPYVYVPYRQQALRWMCFTMRTSVDPLSLVGAVRSEIAAITKEEAPFEFASMTQLLQRSVAGPFAITLVLCVFALAALGLAALGIYGMISYLVTRRTHEIGIRVALGARPSEVLRLVIKHGLALTAAGLGIGLAVSLASTRVLSHLLYEVTATDPATFVGVSVLFAAVALLACYIPARRATRVDPMVALRCE